jgi:putative transport protein
MPCVRWRPRSDCEPEVLDLLAANPLLTIMLVVSLGTLLGAVPFGPVRFGAAGALFVGLGVGALDPRLGSGLGLIQTLGLALFVYMVGIAVGARFFRGLRRQLPLMISAVVVLGLAGLAGMVLGSLLGISPAVRGGVYAGALTSTPALAAAIAKAGSQEPAIGYALSYPIGVTLAILALAIVLTRPWHARRDPLPLAGRSLIDLSVEIEHPCRLQDVPGIGDHSVRFSYLSRDGQVRVIKADDEFRHEDRVVIIGPEEPVQQAVEYLGRRVHHHLADDRSTVDYRRILVSDPRIAGRTIGELDIPGRFDGIVTRLRRGDLDMLAAEDTVVELGDRLRVVVPRGQLTSVARYLGDSERKVSEIDALSLGIGVALGLLLGLIAVPLPGGIKLALGSAAGPLVIGMILGRLERTGPLVWGLPSSASLTIRQLGLASGQAFAAQAFTGLGLRIAVAGAITVGLSAAFVLALARALGFSTARAAGGLAGFVGQPAILAYVNGRTVDERVDAGYAALFALAIIVKILLVQVIVAT